jgi:hypothetical protein
MYCRGMYVLKNIYVYVYEYVHIYVYVFVYIYGMYLHV